MTVEIRFFNDFKEANAYAKTVNASIRKSPLLRRSAGGWEVHGEGVTPNETSNLIDVSKASEALIEIKTALKISTQEFALIELIKNFLAKFGTSVVLQNQLGTSEDAELFEKLEDTYLALESFIDLLEESAHPRSQDEAIYYANRFRSVSDQLQPYPVAGRALKESRELFQKAIKLPVVDVPHQQWLHKTSVLNASGPICRHCQHLARMHIVGERGAELWRCYENNHGTRFLTREQRKFLED
jgi:hypothetical protein